MSFGTGVVLTKSSKQKLNTRSSMEAELVAVSDFWPNHIWLHMLLLKLLWAFSNSVLDTVLGTGQLLS